MKHPRWKPRAKKPDVKLNVIRIRQEIYKRFKSVSDFGRIAQIDRANLNNYLNDGFLPSAGTAYKLCKFLNLTLEDLIDA